MTDLVGATESIGPTRGRRRRRRVLTLLGAVGLLVVLVVGGGVVYLRVKVARIPRVAVSQVLRGGDDEPSTTRATTDASSVLPTSDSASGPASTDSATTHSATTNAAPSDDGRPVNVLLVGVDSADGLAPDDPIRSERERQGVGTTPRPDSVLLARLDPAKGRVSVVSFPRDLWVTVNAAGRHDRLNAATSEGGAAQLITAVTTNFAVPIDHYVQVDFEQFKRLVDVIGGVTISVDRPLRDTHSGLYLPETGCISLSPDAALAYARSRYLEFKRDGVWVSDPTSDLGRTSRQQDFMVAALKRVISAARNPITLNRLLDRAIGSVVLDDAFGAGDLASLGFRFRSFDAAHTERYSLPVSPATIDGKSVLRLREASAQPVLDVFRGVEPPLARPSDVALTLRDGGAGADVVEATRLALAARGFAASTGRPTAAEHSTLTFPLVKRPGAETLARNLTAPLAFDLDDDADGGIGLVLAADFGGVRPTSASPSERATVSSRRVGANATARSDC